MRDFVFGFGSTVDIQKLGEFLRRPLSPAGWCMGHLNGFRRLWNVAMDNSADLPDYKYYVLAESGQRPSYFITFLNLQSDTTSRVNGILFQVDETDLERLDARERNYRRVDVSDRVDPSPPDARVWTYVATEDAKHRYELGVSKGLSRVPADYLRLVREGFAAHGVDSLSEYDRSTDSPCVPVEELDRKSLS